MEVDSATLLRKYGLRTLRPTRWEDVDHAAEGGELEHGGDHPGLNGPREEPDPLGLRETIGYVALLRDPWCSMTRSGSSAEIADKRDGADVLSSRRAPSLPHRTKDMDIQSRESLLSDAACLVPEADVVILLCASTQALPYRSRPRPSSLRSFSRSRTQTPITATSRQGLPICSPRSISTRARLRLSSRTILIVLLASRRRRTVSVALSFPRATLASQACWDAQLTRVPPSPATNPAQVSTKK